MKFKIILFFIGFCSTAIAQKLNTDSLLVVTNNILKSDTKEYFKAKKIAHQCLKVAPDYLDFHMALGRIHKNEQNIDSAKYYFQHVIDANPNYKEAFVFLSKTELEAKNNEAALASINKGIALYPEEKEFYFVKLQIINSEENPKKSTEYLEFLSAKYPEDIEIQNQLREVKSSLKSNRIGAGYSFTEFSRDNYGPWHLSNINYMKQFEKFSLGGRISYIDRRINGSSSNSGYFYEVESYFKTSKKSYSFANIGFSEGKVFPEFRFLYSYYLTLGKGFETEIGYRYNQQQDIKLSTGIVALGKYFKNNWINFRTSFLISEPKLYPSFTSNFRHYYNTKYDYFSLTAGYGTSPDERQTLTQFQNRIALTSYRFGAGYSKLLAKKYIIGLNTSFNNQEYFPEKFQNEYNFSIDLTYLF
ncbi:YaiO family outer membrane beta-barrel protein [Flavobacterium facile]|uniref:YaiO family outer membrane beta-barrel protein n=1 Tax=Flavobacterium facile TaxID=2893174 RepID=UPI002E7675A2|nr:YaiO family outer membrane beta-barrel protein [Flavobacterium sp. T-12]